MPNIFWNILKLLDKQARGKTVLILLFITLAVYSCMLFYTIPSVMNYTGGMKLPDMQPFGYSIEYMKTLLDNMGEPGRDTYLFRQIPVDMIYPLLFALTYPLLLTYLFKKGLKSSSKIHYMSIVPVAAGFFDYLENSGIIFLLVIYPRFSNTVAGLTNIFSILKSLFTTLFFVFLFIGLAAILIGKIRSLKT